MREVLFWFGCLPTRSYITYRSSIKDEYSDTIRLGAFILSAWWLSGMENDTEIGRFGGRAWCMGTPATDSWYALGHVCNYR